MKKTIKQKLCKALRSGDYKQGKHELRSADNEYCCLGVLCDLYRKETNKRWVKNEFDDNYKMHGDAAFLPEEVMEWAGVEDDNLYLQRGGEQIAASYLNDRGVPFTEIADLIEESY